MKRKLLYSLVLLFIATNLSCSVFAGYSEDKVSGMQKINDVWLYFLTTDDFYPSVEIMDFYRRIETSSFDMNALPKDTRTKKYVSYGNGCFVINRDTDRVYKFQNQPFKPHTQELVYVYYYDFQRQQRISPIGSYFNIGGSPVKYNISVSANNVDVYEYGEYRYYTFISEGIISFEITLGEIKETITIEVIELPFNLNSPVDTMIETIGFPDRKKTDGVSWPDSRYVNGFFYSPKAGRSVFKDFYFFKKYPYLVLSCDNNLVDGVSYMRLDD